ncbi:MAG TPA: EcsC family protein [Chitinophagaceae bacterium]|nr:EcsC family protein [Chitinophagaceae bacterium]
MNEYQDQALATLQVWQQKMQQRPSLFSRLSKKIQTKINTYIPEKLHQLITTSIREMIRGVLFGAGHLTASPVKDQPLETREQMVLQRIEVYKNTAAIEGGITGAGGFLLGLADFPVLLGLKLKLLFDIAAMYGFDVNDYKERVYILHIFELAFSSDQHRRNVYLGMTNWQEKTASLPADIQQFDWRSFQQEYRDYIDLAKMAQLLPVIGAPVGIVVNYRLIKKLGDTAMNAYRMRLLEAHLASGIVPRR